MPAVEEENLPTSQPKKMGWLARRVAMQACLMVCGLVSIGVFVVKIAKGQEMFEAWGKE